jgi:hypothetical protein
MSTPRIVQKSFEVTNAPDWALSDRQEAYYTVTVRAASPSKAKGRTLARAMDAWDLDRKQRAAFLLSLKVRRIPLNDVVENVRHPLADQLSEAQLHKGLHAIGGDSATYDPYRNRYVIPGDPDWEGLIELGLARQARALDSHFYYLTPLGIEVVMSTRPISRYLFSERQNKAVCTK